VGRDVFDRRLAARWTFGYVASLSSDCYADGIGPIPSCYRIFGSYVSDTTYYTVAAGLVGAGVGLALGLFFAIPARGSHRREETAVHPLEVPFVWFGLQLLELAVIVPALLFWVPDPGQWPEAARIAVWIIVLIAVTAMNYTIRCRFIPR
jgi:drug/metabolite transporter (DMT)-like permease